MIQIDMSMPKNCIRCPFVLGEYVEGVLMLSCMIPTGRKKYAADLTDRKGRPEWCPLKEQDVNKVTAAANAVTQMPKEDEQDG